MNWQALDFLYFGLSLKKHGMRNFSKLRKTDVEVRKIRVDQESGIYFLNMQRVGAEDGIQQYKMRNLAIITKCSFNVHFQ